MAGTHQLWGYDLNYDRTGVVAGSGSRGPRRRPGRAGRPRTALGPRVARSPARLRRRRELVAARARPGRARRRRGRDRDRRRALRLGRSATDRSERPGCSTPRASRRSRTASSSPTPTTTACAACTWRPEPSRRSPAASPGFRDGTGSEARFFEPGGVARIGDVLIVADTGNHALRRVDLTTGVVTSLLPMGLEPPATPARRLEPATLAADARGHAARDARGTSGNAPRRQRRAARPRSAERRPAGGDRGAGAADGDGAASRGHPAHALGLGHAAHRGARRVLRYARASTPADSPSPPTCCPSRSSRGDSPG